MTKFGWCLDGHHPDCREKFERFYIGPVGKGRTKKFGPIYTGETVYCDCSCHKDEEPPKPKRTRRKK